jgi:hypothetical protein
MNGGLIGVARRIPNRLTLALSKEYKRAQRSAREQREAIEAGTEPAFEPTAMARSLLRDTTEVKS